jgi:hypothetical protein
MLGGGQPVPPTLALILTDRDANPDWRTRTYDVVVSFSTEPQSFENIKAVSYSATPKNLTVRPRATVSMGVELPRPNKVACQLAIS